MFSSESLPWDVGEGFAVSVSRTYDLCVPVGEQPSCTGQSLVLFRQVLGFLDALCEGFTPWMFQLDVAEGRTAGLSHGDETPVPVVDQPLCTGQPPMLFC
jgi:hypothetical protein